MHLQIKRHRETLGCRPTFSMLPLARVVLLLVSLVLLVKTIDNQAQASPLLLTSGQGRAPSIESSKSVVGPGGHNQQMSSSKQDINVIEDLIFRAIDDMGDRLKKNKLHSIKQTLRFGRSDPSMAPTSPDFDLDDAPNDVRHMDPLADYDRNYQ